MRDQIGQKPQGESFSIGFQLSDNPYLNPLFLHPLPDLSMSCCLEIVSRNLKE